MAARAVAHRRQPGAGAEQPLLDALGKTRGELFGQRRGRGLYGERGQHSA